ncbi:MAG: SLBB domain-containing protein, partial [Rectinemataceae bacterium]
PGLADGDTVRVASREEYLPVVYVEGAIKMQDVAASQQTSTPAQNPAQKENTTEQPQQAQQPQEPYGLIRTMFRQGLLLSQVLRPLQAQISEKADLRNAYVVRDGKRMQVNIEQVLFKADKAADLMLQAGDHIVLPYGLWYVYLKGEVKAATAIEIYGGMRLSDALQGHMSQYSNLRAIKVTSRDGSVGVYDNFKAAREGDESQNPLLRPGDIIEITRAERTVKLDGAVYRPGLYQPLPGEGIRELLELYGGGMWPNARTDAVLLTRKATADHPAAESVAFNASDRNLPPLLDGDTVMVPSRDEYLPVVYLEGAVQGEKLGSVD